jgi:hypothetical protein
VSRTSRADRRICTPYLRKDLDKKGTIIVNPYAVWGNISIRYG